MKTFTNYTNMAQSRCCLKKKTVNQSRFRQYEWVSDNYRQLLPETPSLKGLAAF
jgi:hypothetical protein